MARKHEDISGQIFGKLKALRVDESKKKSFWICRCACGNEKSVRTDLLKDGRTVTCGCRSGTRREFVDITGQRFSSLTVKEIVDKTFCVATCDCGTETKVRINNIKRGHTRSCGCLGKDNALRHGVVRRNKRIYQIWTGMMDRCYNESNPHYRNYGGRGIGVADRWHDVRNFEADVAPTYVVGLSIDRTDNDKGYGPDNFRWATKSEQQNNRRVNRRIETPKGIMTIAQAAQAFGIKDHTLRNRLSKGWPVVRALTERIHRNGEP